MELDSYLEIPDEILLEITRFLSYKEVLTIFSLVCSKWNEIARDQSLWRRLCCEEFCMSRWPQDNPEPEQWREMFVKRMKSLNRFKRLGIHYAEDQDEKYVEMDYENNSVAYKAIWPVGVVRCTSPVKFLPFGDSPFFGYYEVQVIRGGNDKIGVGIANESYNRNMPGWRSESYGYHGDDGMAFHDSGSGTPWGPLFTTGDTIGLLYNHDEKRIYYTKNGRILGNAFRDVKMDLDLDYFTVGIECDDAEVLINFGRKPFQFDVKGYARNPIVEKEDYPYPGGKIRNVPYLWENVVVINGNEFD